MATCCLPLVEEDSSDQMDRIIVLLWYKITVFGTFCVLLPLSSDVKGIILTINLLQQLNEKNDRIGLGQIRCMKVLTEI
jgi:hypothetical protein